MCAAENVPLAIYEVPPVENDPDFDKCVLACETCQKQIIKPALMNPDHWRCLNNSVWSEVSAIKIFSVVLLKKLNVSWANDLIDQVYLEEEEQEWLNTIV